MGRLHHGGSGAARKPWWIWHKVVGTPAGGIDGLKAQALMPQDKDLNLVFGQVLHHHGMF